MTNIALNFDADQATSWLLRFLAVEGVTGQEKAIGKEVVKVLKQNGVPGSAIAFDKSNQQIPLPTQTGNLIVKLKGTRKGPRRLFSTHLDTVPLCAGAIPVRKGNRIVADSPTALGGDNRTGVSALVNTIVNLLKYDLPHPPTTFLFTVREESGLWGARFADQKNLGKVSMGFNIDGRSPSEIAVGAVGADRWSVAIRGKASHAGAYPEQGISATMVAAIALAEVQKQGWFGKVAKNGKAGTSNVGALGDGQGGSAGSATNVVTDYVKINGESRSHDAKFIGEITKAFRNAFRDAAKQVTNDKGKTARVSFHADRDYHPFRLDAKEPVVYQALSVAEQIGLKPSLRTVNGGLDANWLTRNGVPTITFGAGQHNIHTVDEFVDVKEYLAGCRLALALATAAG